MGSIEQELAELKRQLTDVQSQLAFQDDTVQALNDALALQQQELLVLRRQMELFKQQQEEQAARHDADEAGVTPDEKPPHY